MKQKTCTIKVHLSINRVIWRNSLINWITRWDHVVCKISTILLSSLKTTIGIGLSRKFNALKLTITMTPKSNFREGEAEQQRALNCPNVNCFHFLLCVQFIWMLMFALRLSSLIPGCVFGDCSEWRQTGDKHVFVSHYTPSVCLLDSFIY